jgi:thiopurine S-methyltransferase
MKKEYWLERWEREDTGFHQDEINPYLREYWHELHLAKNSEVFVPMSGKSRDMLWLRDQGSSVLGVELSAHAAEAFFLESGQTPQHTPGEPFDRSEANGITILCGDFFNVTKDDLRNVSGVYDRGSLIALPPEMRRRYANHLMNCLPQGTQILLLTFDYPQDEMEGPPFAVSQDEVEALYHEHAKISLLARVDVLVKNPRFQQRGLTRLHESVFLLKTQHLS